MEEELNQLWLQLFAAEDDAWHLGVLDVWCHLADARSQLEARISARRAHRVSPTRPPSDQDALILDAD